MRQAEAGSDSDLARDGKGAKIVSASWVSILSVCVCQIRLRLVNSFIFVYLASASLSCAWTARGDERYGTRDERYGTRGAVELPTREAVELPTRGAVELPTRGAVELYLQHATSCAWTVRGAGGTLTYQAHLCTMMTGGVYQLLCVLGQ